MTDPKSKSCTRCKLFLPPESFGPKNGTKDGLNCYCRLCDRAIATERRRRNKEIQPEPPVEKRCPYCSETKPAGSFYSAGSKDGLAGYCKFCTKIKAIEWQKKNPEKKKAADHKENQKPERKAKVRARFDQWRKDHPEKAVQCAKAGALRYKQRHPERLKQTMRRYLDTAKGKATRVIVSNRRRAQKMGAAHPLTREQWYEILARYSERCAYCGIRPEPGRGNQSINQEHLTPLSRGGEHSAENIVPSCFPCNMRKRNVGNATLSEFAAALGFDPALVLDYALPPEKRPLYQPIG